MSNVRSDIVIKLINDENYSMTSVTRTGDEIQDQNKISVHGLEGITARFISPTKNDDINQHKVDEIKIESRSKHLDFDHDRFLLLLIMHRFGID